MDGSQQVGDGANQIVVFRPDSDIVEYLGRFAGAGDADVQLKIEVTDTRSGRQQTMFLRWQEGDIEQFVQHVQDLQNGDEGAVEDAEYQYYFWLFWRGWMGMLNPAVIQGLPSCTPDLLQKVGSGEPLRDQDLRRLRAVLEWSFASATREWGAGGGFDPDTISPSHLKGRKMLGAYLDARMKVLHGPDYEDAPY